MKFKSTAADYQSTVKVGKKMGFAPEAESFLMDMMSDGLYSDKFGSIVREIASNCVDANVESGSTDPVGITITAPSSFTNAGEIMFSDSGIGIDPDRVEDIFTLYFASTKRDGNDMIGGFGIGAKSPFAYTDVFRVETWTDGNKYTYLLEKRGQDRTCTLLSTKAEPGKGTKIRIPIKDRYDYEKFVGAVNKQTVLMRPLSVTLSDNKEYVPTEVFEFKSFYIARDYQGRFLDNSVALGNVIYPIDNPSDFVAKGDYISSFQLIPKLGIGSVMPTMSRENLQLTEEGKIVINDAFDAAINELQQMIDDSQEETTSILEYIRSQNGDTFTIPGTDLEFNLTMGAYRNTLWKNKKTKLIGFEREGGQLGSYAQSLVKVSAQYVDKRSGAGKTFRNARNSDGFKLGNFITKSTHHNWGDVNPRFVRWKNEDKLTAVDKDYIETMFANTNYTSVHFFERNTELTYTTSYYSTLIGGSIEGMSKEQMSEALYNKYGKKILLELMEETDKFADWKAPQEFIDERKARMKDRVKKVGKKDRAKDAFRMRGLGSIGVADANLQDLLKNYPYAIYLTRKEWVELKKDKEQNWMSDQDFVMGTYEKGKPKLFEVSEKTAKEFRNMGVFTPFNEFIAKREARSTYRKSLEFAHGLAYRLLQSEASLVAAFKAGGLDIQTDLKDFRDLSIKYGVECNTAAEAGDIPDTVTFMNRTYNVKSWKDMLTRIDRLTTTSPFLYHGISNVRDWDKNYESIIEEAGSYLFPRKVR